MLSLYLEPYETEPGKTERRVKIVGGEKRSAEERVSSFMQLHCISIYMRKQKIRLHGSNLRKNIWKFRIM